MRRTPAVGPSIYEPVLAGQDAARLRPAIWIACLIHLAAIVVPLPRPPSREPASRPPSDPFVVVPYRPRPPALVEPPRRPRPAATRRLPVPFERAPALEPIVEAVSVAEDSPAGAPRARSLLGEVAPPPPATYDERTAGLVLPERVGDGPRPDYPPLARVGRIEGTVVLRAVVDEAGAIRSVEVLGAPTPDPGFAAAARRAVEGWRYRPGRLRGRAVAVELTVVVEFALR